jgi:hypothetical protein
VKLSFFIIRAVAVYSFYVGSSFIIKKLPGEPENRRGGGEIVIYKGCKNPTKRDE